jgi:tRNA dimethylallyltransferase
MKLSDASADADADVDVRVICGPTAAGKSSIAMWIAARNPTTIISADSRQVYQRFDIGTAKPTAAERVAVVHHGIDVVDPTERYSAALWANSAENWIHDARVSGATPLVVGGTGLYLRALFDGLFEEPQLDPQRRASIAKALGELDIGELRRWTRALDPERGHLGKTQLLRSIEIALLTGRRLSELHRERPRYPRWRPHYLVVDPGPVLNGRIAARIDDMLDHGWPDEVQQLMQTVPENAPAWKATGYDAVRQLVKGELSRSAANERILIETRQYAKRQRTWFRHQLPPESTTRVNPEASDWEYVVAEWSSGTKSRRSRSA